MTKASWAARVIMAMALLGLTGAGAGAATVTRYYSIPPSGFVGNSIDYNGANVGSAGDGGTIFAPMHLPQDAVITDIAVKYYNRQAKTVIKVNLMRMGAAASEDGLGDDEGCSFELPYTGTETKTVHAPDPLSITVRNDVYSHALAIDLSETRTYQVIWGVTVTYEVGVSDAGASGINFIQ